MPVQHASDSILKRMGRRTNQAELRERIQKLRKEIPQIVLRTSLITGFPGETEEEFNELCDFNECTIFSYIISISTSANFYVEITQEKIIDHILNNYFISKNIQLQFNDNIKNQPSSLLNISLRFNWIDESYLTMCITRDGKLYIRTMFGYWLESVDTNIIDIEELENYLNNLNIS